MSPQPWPAIILVILSALLFAQSPGHATEKADLCRGALVHSDFPESPAFTGKKRSGGYPNWAAETANLALLLLQENVSPRNVLYKVSNQRKILEQQLVDKRAPTGLIGLNFPEDFSTLRTRFDSPYITPLLKSPEFEQLVAIAQQYEYALPLFDEEQKLVGGKRSFKFRLATGATIENTTILHSYNSGSEEMFVIEHPRPAVLNGLMTDVWNRIAMAKNSDNTDEKQRQLANAIQAYYRAVPFVRGSASIGRSFWAAVTLHVLGYKTALPSLTDWHAMIREQNDFENWVMPFLQPR